MTAPQVGPVPDECLQVIAVRADDFDEPSAALFCYERDSATCDWVLRAGSEDERRGIKATLGKNGIGVAVDDSLETPAGSFPLGQAFGRWDLPGVKVPYFVIEPGQYWDTGHEFWKAPYGRGEPTTYNTLIESATDPNKANPTHEAEALNEFPAYNYAVFVDHNPTRRPGWGCAIFLHVEDGEDDDEKTAGCIAIKEELMRWVLLWLDEAKSPYLSVLVED